MPSDAFVDHCLELLAPAGGARARRMFGGHGIYLDELFIAIVAGERLYLKADEVSREAFRQAGCEPFHYVARGKTMTVDYWTLPPDAMESPALAAPWLRRAVEAAVRARAARPPRTRPSATGAARTPARRGARR